MAIGMNRQNDTPIGGAPEFRGNMQGGDVFTTNTVPVYDGEKFAPGAPAALLNGFGGLAIQGSDARTADGTAINDWDAVMPLNGGTPLQMTPNATTGIITLDQAGTYEASLTFSIQGMANNRDYFFELQTAAGATGYGVSIVGSNNVTSQSGGFSLQANSLAGGSFSILANSQGNSDPYTIVSMSLSCKRIG